MESFWTRDEVIRSNFASISEIQFPRAKSCRGGSLSSMAARHGEREKNGGRNRGKGVSSPISPALKCTCPFDRSLE